MEEIKLLNDNELEAVTGGTGEVDDMYVCSREPYTSIFLLPDKSNPVMKEIGLLSNREGFEATGESRNFRGTTFLLGKSKNRNITGWVDSKYLGKL